MHRRNPTPTITRELPLRADPYPAARILNATIATESPVAVFDPRSGSVVLEILRLGGAELPRQAPLLLDHQRSVTSMVGSVADFTIDGIELQAQLRFAAGNTAADDAWSLAEQKHLRAVSIGYQLTEYREIRPGQTEVVGGQSYTAPRDRLLRVVTRWALKEASLVPIGADALAGTRSATFSFSGDESMHQTLPQTIGRDVATMTWPEFFSVALRSRGQTVPQNDLDVCRAGLSSVEGAADLFGVVNSAVLGGFRASPDTTAGWVRVQPLPNYLAGELAHVTTAARLENIPRGGTAPQVSFGLSSEGGWRLAKFGATFSISEEDLADSPTIAPFQLAIEEIGAAARRVAVDLIYSVILSNPTLDQDNVALFDATRGNTGTAALADAALYAAMAAIVNQTKSDADGDPVHRGLSPRYLIVPGDLFGSAKALARAISTAENDLVVRPESRIGSAGLVDPATDSIVAGTATNWLLACLADQGPAIVLGALGGRTEPRIRQFELDAGQWGRGFDVSLSLAARAVDPQSLYWSTGAG